MIKGVNRQVLEIHDTGVDCFEKALLFVRPEYSTLSENKLRDKALKMLSDGKGVPRTKKASVKGIILRILGFFGAAGAGALVTMLIR